MLPHKITQSERVRFREFYGRWEDLVQLLLDRSQGAGLDVRVPNLQMASLDSDAGKDAELAFQVRALRMVAPHAQRIRSLHVAPVGKTGPLWRLLCPEVDAPLVLPRLEMLSVDRTYAWSPGAWGWLDGGSDDVPSPERRLVAPRLRAVQVRSAAHVILPGTGGVGGTLTRLTMHDDAQFDAHVWQVLAAHAETLVELNLVLSHLSAVGFAHPPPSLLSPMPASTEEEDEETKKMVFPRLEVLSVTCTRAPMHLQTFLESIWTPKLRRAGIRAGYGGSLVNADGTEEDDVLKVFLREVSGPVTHLTLAYGTLRASHGTILASRLVSSLHHIRVECSTVEVAFLKTLRSSCSPPDTDTDTKKQTLESLTLHRTPLSVPLRSIVDLVVRAAEPPGADGAVEVEMAESGVATPVSQFVPEAVVRYQ